MTIARPSRSLLAAAAVVAACLPAAGPALGQDLQTPVAALRETVVDTFLIDSVWDDAYLETLSESTEELGVFAQDLFSDQGATYQWCDGRVVHESDLFSSGVFVESENLARGLNFDQVNVPVRSETRSTLSYAFLVDGPRRFRLDVEMEIERTAVAGRAEGSVLLASPFATIFSLAAADAASEQEQVIGWLDAGRHDFDVVAAADVDAVPNADPWDDPETSFVYTLVYLQLFAEADVNLDGVVDVNDLIAVIIDWGPCPPLPPGVICPPDIDRDAIVGVDDLVAVILGWSP